MTVAEFLKSPVLWQKARMDHHHICEAAKLVIPGSAEHLALYKEACKYLDLTFLYIVPAFVMIVLYGWALICLGFIVGRLL